MTLSTSRQQFLAYESQAPEDIHYSRRGGVFLSTCVCVGLVILAVVVAALVGVIVYFITYYKLSQKPADFWDETEPFGLAGAAPDLRLPSDVVPSFYRLKIKADLESSNFTGEVYITIRAKKKVKEIVLHSKNLTIINNAKLTEQIYEKVETLHMRRKRDAAENATVVTVDNNAQNETVAPPSVETNKAPETELNAVTEQNHTLNITEIFKNVSNDENATATTVNSITESMPKDTQTQVTHSSVRNINILSITEASGDRLILTLATPLKPDVDYILEIPFEGKISDSLNGFYKSTYVDANKEVKTLVVTQFEPISARTAFPCFDEPAFKAKFEISIAHKKNLTVLSNMGVAAKEDILEQPGWQWTHFDRSVQMSTYLVAYILCEFKSVDTSYVSKDNTTKAIKIWTRPEFINKAQYAASITPKLLQYYEELFGAPYALNKIDLVAIPDFSSGAMENWGLLTFRETTLLFDEANSVPRDKQNVAIDVAHELAHQWFGNLVTMKWWTDLWLNEGFATYVEYLGVDQIEPGWNMFEYFTRDMFDLLRSDALKNTSPVSRRVVDASEIGQKFDEISYTKGATLIRMLNNTMSYELFHKGLVKYLDKWKYSNAEENDLWAAMSAAATGEPVLTGRSLVDFMNSWTRQAGYPVLTAIRDYTTNTVTLQQQLFTSSEHPYKATMNQLWHIPVSFAAVDAQDWSTQPKLWLTDRETAVNLPVNNTQALYINVGATGYYRVNYDHRNWQLLAEAVQTGLIRSHVTKAQLIDDAFNLAKAGLLDYSYALGLTTFVIDKEESKIVWDLLLSNMMFLKHNLRATPEYRYFQDYMRILLRKQLEVLNYGFNKPKDDSEAFLIENLVMWECMVESPRCLDWARGEFDKWMNVTDPVNNNPIPSYLRSLVINMGVKYGGRREFDFLWEVFQNSTDPNVKSLVITNMPSTRSEALITSLLEKSLTEIPKQYAVAAWSVDSTLGSQLAQQYLLDNFDRVYDTFAGMDVFMFPAVLNGAFGSIVNNEELDRFKRFAMEHKEKLKPMSQTLQKLIDISQLRINWLQRYSATINQWFKDYVTGKNNSTTSNSTKSTQPRSDLPNQPPQPIGTNVTTTNTTIQPPIDVANNTVSETAVLADTSVVPQNTTEAKATVVASSNDTASG
ncbi:peptidase family m1 domain-containing protein [Phthorimaea operculella]|nr:peptidase family m1 domain-containing protein [Phthorimaea operculella]